MFRQQVFKLRLQLYGRNSVLLEKVVWSNNVGNSDIRLKLNKNCVI